MTTARSLRWIALSVLVGLFACTAEDELEPGQTDEAIAEAESATPAPPPETPTPVPWRSSAGAATPQNLAQCIADCGNDDLCKACCRTPKKNTCM
jgi:hypothetical protein